MTQFRGSLLSLGNLFGPKVSYTSQLKYPLLKMKSEAIDVSQKETWYSFNSNGSTKSCTTTAIGVWNTETCVNIGDQEYSEYIVQRTNSE